MRLRGEKSCTQRDLVIVSYSNAKDDKGNKWLDVQLNADALDVNKEPQSNLHAFSKKREDGTYNHAIKYSGKQYDAIVAAAGDNIYNYKTKNGVDVSIIGVKGDLRQIYAGQNKGQGFFLNTNKPMSESSFKVSELTIPSQAKYSKESSSIIKAMSEKSKAKEQVKEVSKEQSAEVEQSVAEDEVPF